MMLFHHEYLEERTGRPGMAGWYIIEIADANNAAADREDARRPVPELERADQNRDRAGVQRQLRHHVGQREPAHGHHRHGRGLRDPAGDRERDDDERPRAYIYLGLAGETGRGRTVQSGLYRLADGGDEWETLHNGLPDAPAIRALAVHPLNPDIIYAGTQSGPYRSNDRGEHWEKVTIADHKLPVWSFLFHPYDPDVMFVGYENCEIYRSDDAGEHWMRLPVSVRFPDITTAPAPIRPSACWRWMPASTNPIYLYAAIEVGGTLRSTDGGEHWENLSHGQYLER